MLRIDRYLTTDAANLSALELLHSPPSVLLGVTDAAVAALRTLDIHNVFDLASSKIFANAAMLVEASADPRSVVAKFGMPAGDVLGAVPAGMSVTELPFQQIEILEGIGPANAAGLAAGLNVRTVRDLALWPPHIAARDIVGAVLVPDSAPGFDPDAPADLLPKSGEYPTERVFYSTLVMDGFEGEPAGLKPLEANGPIDVAPAAGPDFGFRNVAVGALLTFSQSWYAQGTSLGQLLHSVALAPGENTRIAMVDWSRRSIGKQDEDVTEIEQLTNITDHSRALAEVTSAVAQEAQSGFSKTHLKSASEEGGAALGVSLGPVTLGGTGSDASSRSDAMSFSSSAGRRDLSASMSQNVVDRTQQQANAARNRRATVVKEVSQSEHETVSTRVVANYNHMHALSIQYYEVVQIYRVAVQLARVEKCLFLPMILIDFTKPELVRLFRDALLKGAIDDDARGMLATNYETVEVKTGGTAPMSLQNAALVPSLAKDDGRTMALPNDTQLADFYLMPSGQPAAAPAEAGLEMTVRLRDGTTVELERTDSKNFKLRKDVALHQIASVTMTNPLPTPYTILVAVGFRYKGLPFTLTAELAMPAAAGPHTLLTCTGGGLRQQLVDHLLANRLHYSQAVFRSLDPATVTLLLSPYSYRGKPFTVQVDPQPVTVAGNYLVFKMHVHPDNDADNAEEREWAQWLTDHGVSFDQVNEDLVPLPSGGVFAEAVLGRYNSAEKLDVSRFWNWQDSPIPLQASDIAAIQTGTRATTEELKAAPFSQPLVNIVSPTALPDPAGLGAVLSAITNGNMFRDMSGLAATVGLAQAGLQATSEGAGRAGAQAGANLVTAAQKEIEMAKTAVAAMQAMMGNPNGQAGSAGNISQQGALINHGRNMDSRGVTGAGVPAATSPHGAAGSGGTGGVADAADPGGIATGTDEMVHVDRGNGVNELEATRAALWPQLGQAPGQFFQNAVAAGPNGGAVGAPVAARTATLPPVPAPTPFALPPVRSMPGPASHPPLRDTCPTDLFWRSPHPGAGNDGHRPQPGRGGQAAGRPHDSDLRGQDTATTVGCQPCALA
jgi:hypothetical protein